MSKIEIIKEELSNDNELFDNMLFIDLKKVFVNGTGIIKIDKNYITIDDKLIVENKMGSLDVHGIERIENIKNINGPQTALMILKIKN